jgi:hypothetical protein
MPYKVIGKRVYHLKGGRWGLKQTAKSHANAIRTVRLLYGLKHGMNRR